MKLHRRRRPSVGQSLGVRALPGGFHHLYKYEYFPQARSFGICFAQLHNYSMKLEDLCDLLIKYEEYCQVWLRISMNGCSWLSAHSHGLADSMLREARNHPTWESSTVKTDHLHLDKLKQVSRSHVLKAHRQPTSRPDCVIKKPPSTLE